MKKWLLIVTALGLAACSDKEVADVSLGLFTTKDIKIQTFNDPKIPGVTCHISHVEANLDFADPSDMSIACRQTGEITAAMLQGIDLIQKRRSDIQYLKKCIV